MIFPVTTSDTVLEFDALPALKCTCWQSGSRRVYTMARLYVLAGDLQLSLSAFEREPAPESTIGFLLAGTGGRLFFTGLSPRAAWLQKLSLGAAALPGPLPPQGSDFLAVERFSGVDEQGWYWGVRFSLPRRTLEAAGRLPQPGGTFKAGLLKYGAGPLGSSYHPDDPGRPLDAACLDEFLVVDY